MVGQHARNPVRTQQNTQQMRAKMPQVMRGGPDDLDSSDDDDHFPPSSAFHKDEPNQHAMQQTIGVRSKANRLDQLLSVSAATQC